jgi:hypothetical protein
MTGLLIAAAIVLEMIAVYSFIMASRPARLSRMTVTSAAGTHTGLTSRQVNSEANQVVS